MLEALPAGAHGNRAVSACFVLFCAEWYRREYRTAHGWTWEPIHQILGLSVAAPDRPRIVPKGLEGYWGRPLHVYKASGHRDFLGSVFSEGGLPFRLLQSEDSRFNALFSQLLKQYDQWQMMGFNTLQQVERRLERTTLPDVFKSPASIELIAGMVDQLIQLVANYSLDESKEPVETLNRLYPKWRETFPLPLDEKTGSELLNSLLATATDERKKRQSSAAKLSCEHLWNEGSRNSIRLHITLPETLHFPLDLPPSTARFNLVITAGDKILKELGSGYAEIKERHAKVRPRQRKLIVEQPDPSHPLNLAAMVGGAIIASISIPDSTIAFGEAPVGFERAGDDWRLTGQASFTTQGSDVLLVLPDECTYESEDGGAISEVDSTSTPFGFRTIRVHGRTEIHVQGDEIFRVRTGRETGNHAKIALIGDLPSWPTKPAMTFVGFPQVRWRQEIHPEDDGCDLYVSGKKPGDEYPQDMLGTQFVSARNQSGVSLLRRKVGVLPPDFRLEMRSGAQPGRGSILVFTKFKCLLSVVNDQQLKTKLLPHDDHVELRVESDGVPPANVYLRVTPNLLADPIELRLPFPGFGCLAYNGNGQPLPQALSLDDLLGARLHLLGQHGKRTNFTLDLTFRGGNSRKIYYQWNYDVSDKPAQIELFSLREQIVNLLSLDSGIDQTVRLQVLMNGSQRAWHNIRRYHSTARLDDTSRLVQFDDTSTNVQPVLITLPDPGRRPVELTARTSEGVATGAFELPNTPEDGGPWLVVPKPGSKTSFRPLLLPSNKKPVEDRTTIQTLEKAAANVDFNLPERGFANVFDAMAENPKHSGWEFLKAHLDNYPHLPLATFETWKALVGRHSPALAMSLFKFEMDPDYVGRIEHEFPFLWEIFPVNKLLEAAARFETFLDDAGISQEAIPGVMRRMFERLTTVTPAFGASIEAMHRQRKENNTDPAPPASILESWYKDLLRDRSEAQWPEFGSRRLTKWHEEVAAPILTFEPAHRHHQAVVYFPVFAAAVASDRVALNTVFDDRSEAIFLLRRVRDFDTHWFEAVYQFSLAAITSQGK